MTHREWRQEQTECPFVHMLRLALVITDRMKKMENNNTGRVSVEALGMDVGNKLQ